MNVVNPFFVETQGYQSPEMAVTGHYIAREATNIDTVVAEGLKAGVLEPAKFPHGRALLALCYSKLLSGADSETIAARILSDAREKTPRLRRQYTGIETEGGIVVNSRDSSRGKPPVHYVRIAFSPPGMFDQIVSETRAIRGELLNEGVPSNVQYKPPLNFIKLAEFDTRAEADEAQAVLSAHFPSVENAGLITLNPAIVVPKLKPVAELV